MAINRSFGRGVLRHEVFQFLSLILVLDVLLDYVLFDWLWVIKALFSRLAWQSTSICDKHGVALLLGRQAIHLHYLLLNGLHPQLIWVIIVHDDCPGRHQGLVRLHPPLVMRHLALVERIHLSCLIDIVTLILIVDELGHVAAEPVRL